MEQFKNAPLWMKALIILGLIYFATSGLLKVTTDTAKDVIVVVGPDAKEAVTQLGEYLPGIDPIQVAIGDKTYQLVGGKTAGTEWTSLFGEFGAGSTASNGTGGNIGATAADMAADMNPQETADAQALFDQNAVTLASLVGGTNVPDFSAVMSYNVLSARTTLAQMRANAFNLAAIGQWEAQLEKAVQQGYITCFQIQDLNCVLDWDSLQTRALVNPAGLAEWIVVAAGDGTLGDLVAAATNTNANVLANTTLSKMYAQAVEARKTTGCDNVKAGSPTALDLQWCYAGRTVELVVDEGWDLPGAVGGGRGILDENDKITIDGHVVAYAIAVEAVPGLKVDTNKVTFGTTPTLWNQNINPWVPGQLLP